MIDTCSLKSALSDLERPASYLPADPIKQLLTHDFFQKKWSWSKNSQHKHIKRIGKLKNYKCLA
jgi:hypothetical protein